MPQGSLGKKYSIILYTYIQGIQLSNFLHNIMVWTIAKKSLPKAIITPKKMYNNSSDIYLSENNYVYSSKSVHSCGWNESFMKNGKIFEMRHRCAHPLWHILFHNLIITEKFSNFYLVLLSIDTLLIKVDTFHNCM